MQTRRMNQKKSLKALYSVFLLGIGAMICYYFWMNNSLDSLRRLPMYVMMLCLIYVLTQVVKRITLKENNWWDWLYYIGLASAMIPTFMATNENLSMMRLLTDFGSIFLLIPVLFDGKSLFKTAE